MRNTQQVEQALVLLGLTGGVRGIDEVPDRLQRVLADAVAAVGVLLCIYAELVCHGVKVFNCFFAEGGIEDWGDDCAQGEG